MHRGGERDGHRELLAEQRRRDIDGRNIAQHALAQRDGFEVGGVPPQRGLGVGATIDGHVRAGDEASLLAAQEADHLAEVVGVAHEAGGDAERRRVG